MKSSAATAVLTAAATCMAACGSASSTPSPRPKPATFACGLATMTVTAANWFPDDADFFSHAIGGIITLRNTSASACHLVAPPTVEVANPSTGPATLRVYPPSSAMRHQTDVAGHAAVILSVRTAWPTAGPCPQPITDITRLTLRFGASVLSLPVPTGQTAWMLACGGTQSVGLSFR